MDYLEGAQKSLFRWEALQEYKVEGGEDMEGWWNFIKKKRDDGVAMQRVRLITHPLTEYTRREIQMHHRSNEMGDDIRFVLGSDVKITREDFWMIDDHVVLSMQYGPQGEYKGFKVIDYGISEYKKFRDAVWSKSRDLKLI